MMFVIGMLLQGGQEVRFCLFPPSLWHLAQHRGSWHPLVHSLTTRWASSAVQVTATSAWQLLLSVSAAAAARVGEQSEELVREIRTEEGRDKRLASLQK